MLSRSSLLITISCLVRILFVLGHKIAFPTIKKVLANIIMNEGLSEQIDHILRCEKNIPDAKPNKPDLLITLDLSKYAYLIL